MPSSSEARISRQKLASAPPIILADRWPQVIETENRSVHNSAANTGRTLAGPVRPVENAATRVVPGLGSTACLRTSKQPHEVPDGTCPLYAGGETKALAAFSSMMRRLPGAGTPKVPPSPHRIPSIAPLIAQKGCHGGGTGGRPRGEGRAGGRGSRR